MEDYEKEALEGIKENQKRRLLMLQKMAALTGYDTKAEIRLEIEELQKKLDTVLEKAEREHQSDRGLHSDIVRGIITIEKDIIGIIGAIVLEEIDTVDILKEMNVIYNEMNASYGKCFNSLINLYEQSDQALASINHAFLIEIVQLTLAVDVLNAKVQALEQKSKARRRHLITITKVRARRG